MPSRKPIPYYKTSSKPHNTGILGISNFNLFEIITYLKIISYSKISITIDFIINILNLRKTKTSIFIELTSFQKVQGFGSANINYKTSIKTPEVFGIHIKSNNI